MNVLSAKQKYPLSLGVVLMLTLWGALTLHPVSAQESVLRPAQKPSELLLPALHSALNQEHSGTTSFLNPKSFQVRENEKADKSARRLKSAHAKSDAPVKQESPQVKSAFPSINPSLTKVQRPSVAPIATDANNTNEVLQYDPKALFALRLVPAPPQVRPELNGTVPNQTAGQRNMSNTPALFPTAKKGNEVIAPSGTEPQRVKLPALANESERQHNVKSMPPEKVSSLLVMPPKSNVAQASQPVTAPGGQVSRPSVTAEKNEFNLGAAAMTFINDRTNSDASPIAETPKPKTSENHNQPWFAKLPDDDFLIGFDHNAEIGRAKSHGIAEASVKESAQKAPESAKHVPIPSVPVKFNETTEKTKMNQVLPEVARPDSSVTTAQNKRDTSSKQVEKSQPKKEEKSDFFSKLGLKLKAPEAPVQKQHASSKQTTKKSSTQESTKKSTGNSTAKKKSSGSDISTLFTGMNPFAKKKK